ncbi:unnamed protein product [Schistocephalus solidus]|uniref:Reverse transcriptase domain-containing protein n=1 Tax=Schistocephalus solidus TaxID=70667 RepID=A0A183TM97_SCHSO|nr:unnamed protein product [Schistocephalus solidus]
MVIDNVNPERLLFMINPFGLSSGDPVGFISCCTSLHGSSPCFVFRVAALSQLQLPQNGVDAEDSGALQGFRVRDPVLPSQLQYSAEAAEMEVIQLPGLVQVDGPGLRYVQEGRQDDMLVHLQFGVQVNTVAIPFGDNALPALTKYKFETNALDLPPSLPGTTGVVQQISTGKVPESDALTLDFYKHGGSRLMVGPTTIFQAMWRQKHVPQDLQDIITVYIYKSKWNQYLCENHRGISLLNIAGEFFSRIFIHFLNGNIKHGLLPKSQCGFRRHRGTNYIIFANRQRQEK